MKNYKFFSGNLGQWKCYKKSSKEIWLAGYYNNKFPNEIFNIIADVEIINTNLCKKIFSYLGENFGIVIITNKWAFAAVDYSRSYPIYYSFEAGKLVLAAHANTLEKSMIDYNQLIAFRMSGYTIGNNTLWEKIKSISAGNFLFFKNEDLFFCKEYFTFLPKENFCLSYSEYQSILKYEIDKLIKSLIKAANGKTIIIPLSAGLDSRLIASGLRHYNYNNVKCFSYGIRNNYESSASRIIAKKLNYSWTFVEITYQKASNFYKSKKYFDYITKSADGCATSTIQGLFAIDFLINNRFINKNDIIINGNSGDFISGGHIPSNIPRLNIKKNEIEKKINKIMLYHFDKHYSLWETLKNKKNKKIIKKELIQQIKNKFKHKIMPLYAIIEFLEYDNRQTKYVVNSQRIYDFYNIKWLLPLWNRSFIKFWEKVPMKYKINQKLYRDTLRGINYANVWTDDFNFKFYLSPKWIIYVRFIFKLFFFFIGKKEWRLFEKKYINYWSENIYGFSSVSYLDFINNKNIARNYVSIYTLIAEKNNLGKNWQYKE